MDAIADEAQRIVNHALAAFYAPMRRRKEHEMTATIAPLTERPAWKALETHYQQIREVTSST